MDDYYRRDPGPGKWHDCKLGRVGRPLGAQFRFYLCENRYTKEFIDNGDYFSCTFFDKKFKNDLKYFGVVSGRQEDKFKTSGLHINAKDGIPFVDEGNFVLLCKKMAAVPITEAHFMNPDLKKKWYSGKEENNFHTMYVGELVELLAR